MLNNKGFTLIEVIIVATIMCSIVVVMQYPSKYLRDIEHRVFVDTVYSEILGIKELANQGEQKLWINTVDGSDKISIGHKQISIPNHVEVFMSRNALYFGNDASDVKSGTITIRYNNKQTRITLTPVIGKVNIYR